MTFFLFSAQPNSQSLHTGHGRCANVCAKCSDSNENISGAGEEHQHKHRCFESALARAGGGDPGLESTAPGWGNRPQTPDNQRRLMLPGQQPRTQTTIHISEAEDWGSFGTLPPCKALQTFPQSVLTFPLCTVLHRLCWSRLPQTISLWHKSRSQRGAHSAGTEQITSVITEAWHQNVKWNR